MKLRAKRSDLWCRNVKGRANADVSQLVKHRLAESVSRAERAFKRGLVWGVAPHDAISPTCCHRQSTSTGRCDPSKRSPWGLFTYLSADAIEGGKCSLRITLRYLQAA